MHPYEEETVDDQRDVHNTAVKEVGTGIPVILKEPIEMYSIILPDGKHVKATDYIKLVIRAE